MGIKSKQVYLKGHILQKSALKNSRNRCYIIEGKINGDFFIKRDEKPVIKYNNSAI